MNITEATQRAIELQGGIIQTNTEFLPVLLIPEGVGGTWIMAVDNTILTNDSDEPVLWNPKADDLVAENWEPIVFNRNLLRINGMSYAEYQKAPVKVP